MEPHNITGSSDSRERIGWGRVALTPVGLQPRPMSGARAHPALHVWAMILALLLAFYGVLPQAHLAWEHEPACDCHPVGHPGQPSPAPAEPEHPACGICQAFLAAPPLNLPEPPPAALVQVLPVQIKVLSEDSGVLVGIAIRWSLARGPPRA